ncbi:MAG: TolC family protein [Rickettsiales bacterium]|jgi:TolC family type I secretion outer membrane protein|nr:TolC family protein [Rickettsiales bacterium]
MHKFCLSILLVIALAPVVNAAEPSLAQLSASCRFSKDLASDELDLADVIELAMCNNSNTRAAWLSAKSAQSVYRKSLSSYFPSLSANASYGRNITRFNYTDRTLPDQVANSAGFGASLNWLLYDFGRRGSASENAFQTMNSRNFMYNSTLQDVAYIAISNYYQSLSAIEGLAAAKANVETVEKAFELASKKFELGMSSKADRLQAETQLVQAQLDVARQEQVVRTAKANLMQSLGLSPSLTVSLAKPLEISDDDPVRRSVGEIVETALAKRPDLAAKVADMNAAYADVRYNSASFFPTLSAFAESNWNVKVDDDNNTGTGIDRSTHALGVRLSVPIFSGFDTTYSLRNAKYLYALAREQVRLKEQDVELAVVNAYNDYKTSLKSFELAKKMFDSASESEHVARGSYQAGKGDIISLLDAQSRLVSARKEKIDAQYGLYIYRVALLRASGELSLKNLRDAEAWPREGDGGLRSGPVAARSPDPLVEDDSKAKEAKVKPVAADAVEDTAELGGTPLAKPDSPLWAENPVLPEIDE